MAHRIDKTCVIDHQHYKIGAHGLAYVWSRTYQDWIRTVKDPEEIKAILYNRPKKIKPKKIKSGTKVKPREGRQYTGIPNIVKSYLDKHPEPIEYD